MLNGKSVFFSNSILSEPHLSHFISFTSKLSRLTVITFVSGGRDDKHISKGFGFFFASTDMTVLGVELSVNTDLPDFVGKKQMK